MPASLERPRGMPLLILRENNQKISIKKKHFLRAKTQYLNLKAPNNNVKVQSDKSLTKQIYVFLTTKQMGIFRNETR